MNNSNIRTIHLKDALGLLRRQIRTVLLVVVLIMSGAVIFLSVVTPVFTASTLLLIDPAHENILSPDDGLQFQATTEHARIESEVEILKSNTVALATIENTGLLTDPEFGPRIGFPEKARAWLGLRRDQVETGPALLNATLERLCKATQVRRHGLTFLISVTVTSQDPARAALLANATAQSYIALQLQSKIRTTLTARDALQGQVQAALTNLSTTQQALDQFVDANIARLAAETGNANLTTLHNSILRATTAGASISQTTRAAQSALEGGNWRALATTLGDEALNALSAQRAQLARNLAQADDRARPDVDLHARLAEIDKRLEARAHTAISALQGNAATLQEQAVSGQNALRRAIMDSNLSPVSLAQIYEIQQEADIAYRQYTTLLSRVRDLEAQALVQLPDSRIVSPALAPSRVSFPNTKLVLGLALLGALGLGAALAFLNEHVIGGVTSPEQLENIAPVMVAATVANVALAPGQLTASDHILDTPLSTFPESLRHLRAGIDQACPPVGDANGRVIAITSSLPQEGKSTLALGLARTYAVLGRKTLLVDADLRRPTLNNHLGLTPDAGFSEYLIDPTQADAAHRCCSTDPRSGARVVLGHSPSPTPTDNLLQSQAFESFLNQARAHYDVIVMDTAPLLAVVDARVIAPFADVGVFCVRFGETSQGDVRAGHALLSRNMRPDAPILSVLSRAPLSHDSHRYGGYYTG